MDLLGTIDAAERQSRGATGVTGRQTATPVLVFEQQEMRCDLAIEALIIATGPHSADESLKEPP
jgi:hypothetical protein